MGIQQLYLGGGLVEIPDGNHQYYTPGSYQWTVPQFVTAARVVVIGGGGGGGQWSGGGGGGAAMKLFEDLVPGTQIAIVVGAKGAKGKKSTATDSGASNGGTTSFNGTGSDGIYATGGEGGHDNQNYTHSSQMSEGGQGYYGQVNGTGGIGHTSANHPANTFGYLSTTLCDGTNGAGVDLIDAGISKGFPPPQLQVLIFNNIDIFFLINYTTISAFIVG